MKAFWGRHRVFGRSHASLSASKAGLCGLVLFLVTGCGRGIQENYCAPSPTSRVGAMYVAGLTNAPASLIYQTGQAAPPPPPILPTPKIVTFSSLGQPDAGAFFSAVPAIPISSLGCAAQDVDLNTGRGLHGGPATDDGPCIRAALATASSTHPVLLVQDGASLVSGIEGPLGGYWGIVGKGGGFTARGQLTGTGFYQKSGTNDDVIRNGPPGFNCPSDPGFSSGAPIPARGKYMLFRDFVINGNRGDGRTGNSNTGNPRGHENACWFFGIDIMDLDGVEVSGITFYDTSTYNLRLSNVGYANVTRSMFANMGPSPASYVNQNGDGAHVNGPANDINIFENTFVTTDDAIALNAREGWGGLIQHVKVINNTVKQAETLIRMYTGSVIGDPAVTRAMVSDVEIDNLNGRAQAACATLGIDLSDPPTRPATINNVRWTNSKCEARSGIVFHDTIGDIHFSNFQWSGAVEKRAFFNGQDRLSTVNGITVDNLTIVRGSKGAAAIAVIGNDKNASIQVDRFMLNGLKVVDDPNIPMHPMSTVTCLSGSSSIQTVDLQNVDMTNIRSLTNSSNP